MPERQSRNVSLSPHDDRFIDAMVAAGRYRTASDVVRDALRMLERVEHQRLLEKWVVEQLTPEEDAQLPEQLKERVRAHFQALIDGAIDDIEHGRVVDGPTAMTRLRERLEAEPR